MSTLRWQDTDNPGRHRRGRKGAGVFRREHRLRDALVGQPRRKGRVCIAEDQDRQRDAVAAQVARFAQAADREPGRPGPVQRAGDSHGPVAVGIRLDDGAHRPPGRAVHIGEIVAQGVEVDLGPAVAFEPVFIAIALHGVFLPKAARYFIGLL